MLKEHLFAEPSTLENRVPKNTGLGGWVSASFLEPWPVQFPEDYRFEIPLFRLGKLRSDRLRYKCDKVSPDYYS